MDRLRRVYCIGLGGVGVSAVAKYFLRQGATVSGADLIKSPLVEEVIRLGGIYYPTHDPRRLTKDIDLVVYTDDCGPDHPERLAAAKLGLPSENFSQTLGRIMNDYERRLAIAGTNGKSTTTALTGLLLAGAGLDPTVFVGSRVSLFDGNLRSGRRQFFVAEADEYRDHFLNLHPTVATVTNIELDHVNYFHSLQKVIDSFKRFVDRVDGGKIVVNADDPIAYRTFGTRPKSITFGQKHEADLQVTDLHSTAGQQTFELTWQGRRLGSFTLHLPGMFNVMNAAAAIATGLAAGVDPKTFTETIAAFRGIWRRFEILTKPGAAVTVVSDYAHHPTAVCGTLEGARKFFPGRRIVAVFQPHHHNRLTALFDDFAKAFKAADAIIIVEVYAVPGRKPEIRDNKTGKDLAAAVRRKIEQVTYASDPDDAAEKVKNIIRDGDVVIIMGAGDIWTIAEPLAGYYER